jgi:hypothetical protein
MVVGYGVVSAQSQLLSKEVMIKFMLTFVTAG